MAAIKAKNQMSNELSNLLTGIANKSKTAAAELSRASSGSKNDALNKMAHDLIKKADYIIAENQKDFAVVERSLTAETTAKSYRFSGFCSYGDYSGFLVYMCTYIPDQNRFGPKSTYISDYIYTKKKKISPTANPPIFFRKFLEIDTFGI